MGDAWILSKDIDRNEETIMNSEKILGILLSKPTNEFYIKRYIKFLMYCVRVNKNTKCTYYESHHICPKSIFPEFKKFSQNPWNKIRLSGRQHFIAHIILAKAFGGSMIFCIQRMAKQCNIDIDSKKYEHLRQMQTQARTSMVRGSTWWYDEDLKKHFFCKDKPTENAINKRINTYNKGKAAAYNELTHEIIFFSKDEMLPEGFVFGSPKCHQSMWFNSDTGKSEYFMKGVTPEGNYVKGSPNSASWRMMNIKTGEVLYSKTKDMGIDWINQPQNKNTIWVTDGVKFIRVDKNNIPEGFTRGSNFQNGIKRTAGKKWYFNPSTNETRMFDPNDIPIGWIPGRG